MASPQGSSRPPLVAVPTSTEIPLDPLTRVTVVLAILALPVLLPTGPGNVAPADVAVLLAVGAGLLRAAWTHERTRIPYLLGVGLLVTAGTWSALAGSLPGTGLLAVAQDIFLLAWAAVLAGAARTPEGARLVVNAWALSGCAWGVVLVLTAGPALLGEVSAGTAPERLRFTFSDENGAGLYFVLCMLVMVAARRPRRRLLRWTGLGCLGVATLASGSLGAISGLLAGVAAGAVLGARSRRGAALALALGVALCLGTASAVVFSQRYHIVEAAHDSASPLLRNSLGRGYQSSSSREQLAKETIRLWRTAPVWGRGPVSTEATLRAVQAPYPKEAHNDWLAALVERGVVGALGLLLLVAEVAVWAGRSWSAPRLWPGYAAALPSPHLLVGALATLLIFSLTHEVLHDRTMWTLLGLLAGFGIYGRAGRRPGSGVTP